MLVVDDDPCQTFGKIVGCLEFRSDDDFACLVNVAVEPFTPTNDINSCQPVKEVRRRTQLRADNDPPGPVNQRIISAFQFNCGDAIDEPAGMEKLWPDDHSPLPVNVSALPSCPHCCQTFRKLICVVEKSFFDNSAGAINEPVFAPRLIHRVQSDSGHPLREAADPVELRLNHQTSRPADEPPSSADYHRRQPLRKIAGRVKARENDLFATVINEAELLTDLDPGHSLNEGERIVKLRFADNLARAVNVAPPALHDHREQCSGLLLPDSTGRSQQGDQKDEGCKYPEHGFSIELLLLQSDDAQRNEQRALGADEAVSGVKAFF